jgi:chloramphenicol-sensitive protein RarD
MNKASDKPHETTALLAGLAAFVTWGMIPGYWKLLKEVPAIEILANRFVWSSLFLMLLLTWQRRWPEVKQHVQSRRTLFFCIASGLTVSINWFMFIWAVNIGRVTETSLGYFMTPLVNVLLGALLLRERMTRLQFISVLLATLAVLNLTFGYGRFPWVAMILCVSFGFYGLLRKKSGTAAIPGLFLETIILMPVALAYLLFLHAHDGIVFERPGSALSVLLMSTGVVTAVPLLWFGYAARHLRLITVGFLQYISPTGSLLLAIFAYHEPFTHRHAITFGLIWIALAIFSYDVLHRWRSQRIRTVLEPSTCPPEATREYAEN